MPSRKSAILKFVDSFVGPAACALLSRPQKNAERRKLQDTEGPILLIRPGGIGDAVMLLPALRALKTAAPTRPIDILCESRNEAVFNFALPESRTISYDKTPLRALRALRRNAYACVLDTEQFHNFSGVMTALTRAPLRIGFKINTNRRGLYTHLVGYDLDGPEDLQFGRLLESALGHAVALPPRCGILKTLPTAVPLPQPAPDAKPLAIHAGGSVSSKRCPANVIADAARAAAHKHGLAISILGAAPDAAYAAEIESLLAAPLSPPLQIVNHCGKLTLNETAQICASARALLGPDSGIAHLAVAAGTPAVVLFGPSDPRKWAPPQGAGKAVRIDLPCSPCSIFGYTKPCDNHECVCGITREAISAALEDVLNNARPRAHL